MKIVLLENVEHLGIVGDVKEVAEGYARNYLLPKKLAAKVGDKNARILLKDIVEKRKKIKAEVDKTQKLATKLNGQTLEFTLKTTDKGKLFGSIGAKEVAEKLKLDTKMVQMSPIKTVGEHSVKVYLGHNIYTSILINIKSIAKKGNKREDK